MGAGSQFDPECVEAFLRIQQALEQYFNQAHGADQTVGDSRAFAQLRAMVPVCRPVLPEPSNEPRFDDASVLTARGVLVGNN